MHGSADPDKVYIKVDEDNDPAKIAAQLTKSLSSPGTRTGTSGRRTL